MSEMVRIAKFRCDRSFGVELELGNSLTINRVVELVRECDKEHVIIKTDAYRQDYNNNHWHIKLDRSCGDVNGIHGVEIASYKASSIKDIKLFGKVTKNVQENGGNVNQNCAIHVHVEVTDFEQEQMSSFVANWIKIEPHLIHSVPGHRANNAYCRTLRNESLIQKSKKTEFNNENFWSMVRPRNFDNADRRKTLNLCCYGIKRKTIEFRFPEGSLDYNDVKNWTRFFVHLVEINKKSKFPENLDLFNFKDFLNYCGLSGDDPFLILSKALREVKIWLLSRIVKFSRSPELIEAAKKHLNLMTFKE